MDDDKFLVAFGVTKDSLRHRGVDPDEYARLHIHEALKSKRNRSILLSDETRYGLSWTTWGCRAFIAMFIGLGLLFLSHAPGLHWPALGLAMIDAVIVVIMVSLSVRYRVLARRAPRQRR